MNTNNRDYPLPKDGGDEDDWGRILNEETFAAIDSDAQTIDDKAQKSVVKGRTDDPADPEAGTSWYRIDRNTVRTAVEDGEGGVVVIEERAVYEDKSFSEGFEDDISEYSDNGLSGSATVVTSPVAEGSQALELETTQNIANGETPYTITAQKNYPAPPFDFEFYINTPSGGAGFAGIGQTFSQDVFILHNPGQTAVAIENQGTGNTISIDTSGYDTSGYIRVKGRIAATGAEIAAYQSDGTKIGSATGDIGTISADTDYVIFGAASGDGSSYVSNIDGFTLGSFEKQGGKILHSDLSGINSDDHHTRPTAGAGIQDNAGTFRTRYVPEDLSQRTGSYDGEVAADDGTNTPARGTLCLWDDLNSTWRPQHDPDAGAF